jgi:hypothetical protein
MLFENELGENERYYPAHIECASQENGKRVYVALRIDAESQRILDCKWNATNLERERENLENFTNEIIGLKFPEIKNKSFGALFFPTTQTTTNIYTRHPKS